MGRTLYVTGKISERDLYSLIKRYLKYKKRKKVIENVGTLSDVLINGDEEPYKIEIGGSK